MHSFESLTIRLVIHPVQAQIKQSKRAQCHKPYNFLDPLPDPQQQTHLITLGSALHCQKTLQIGTFIAYPIVSLREFSARAITIQGEHDGAI